MANIQCPLKGCVYVNDAGTCIKCDVVLDRGPLLKVGLTKHVRTLVCRNYEISKEKRKR